MNAEFINRKYIQSGMIKEMIKICSQVFLLMVKVRKKITFTEYKAYVSFCQYCCQFMLVDFEDIDLFCTSFVESYKEYTKIFLINDNLKYIIVNIFDCIFMLSKINDVLVFEEFLLKGTCECNNIFYENETGTKFLIYRLC